MAYRVRAYRFQDLPHLAEIYRNAIRELACEHYTPEQIIAWSALGTDHTRFRAWVEAAETHVALAGRTLTGFAGMDQRGHIHSLFVAPEHARRGVATALLQTLIAQATRQRLAELTTAASALSRPLFERFGFTVLQLETTQVAGVTFERHVMALRMGA